MPYHREALSREAGYRTVTFYGRLDSDPLNEAYCDDCGEEYHAGPCKGEDIKPEA